MINQPSGAMDRCCRACITDHTSCNAVTYPQYDHTAVIVAEEITGRFLNVISLFNGFIPLVAIQMQAFRLADQITLLFTTVLDQLKLGLVDEDEEVAEVTDRDYWEKRGSKTTLETTDQLLGIVREIDAGLALKYNKFYIGFTIAGRLWIAHTMDWTEDFDHSLLNDEALLFLIEHELDPVPAGITKQVVGRGLDSLAEKQRDLFKELVVDEWLLRRCRVGKHVVNGDELIGLWLNEGWCGRHADRWLKECGH